MSVQASEGPCCAEPRSEEVHEPRETNTNQSHICIIAHKKDVQYEDFAECGVATAGDRFQFEDNGQKRVTTDKGKAKEEVDDKYAKDDEEGVVELGLPNNGAILPPFSKPELFEGTSAPASASQPSSYSFSIYKPRPLPPLPSNNMPGPDVPKPGPAKLTRNAGLPEWLEEAKQCHYLPEIVMKQLCEIVKEHLMEGVLSTL